MSTGRIRWLYDELPGLVRSGVLDAPAAESLRRHYGPVPETTARRMLVALFGVLGALLVGAGIVLLLGHNWDELSRTARAGLSFGLLLSAQGLAGWAFWRRRDVLAWYEGASVFLGMAIAATIALIAQTYQIGGDLESFLLTWTVLLLPVPYLLRSRAAAALYWICVTWRLAGGSWYGPVDEQAGIYLLLVGLIAPFTVWLCLAHRDEVRTALILWTASICLVIAGFNVLPRITIGLWLPISVGFFGSLYVLGLLRHHGDDLARVALWRRPLQAIGASGLAVILVVFSFAEVWREAAHEGGGEDRIIVFVTAGVVGLVLIALSSLRGMTLWREGQRHRALLALAPLLVTGAWAVGFYPGTSGWLMLVVNGFGLAVGLSAAYAGFRGGSLGTANCGLLLVITLVAARFFDEDWSFVVRGVAFILLGAAFLVTNLWMLKRRKEVHA